ncbi:MAG TPA: EamA family transporter RarD [Spirochaetota bacterium]|nr:EamA family transporter RarD [Spirochaetota bacterium]HPJ33444.1 EamA family transporter RarD [Spirochaetota bacterium]
MNFKIINDPALSMKGTVFTFLAFVMWGLLPGYWKQLKAVPAEEIICHRVMWSFLVSASFLFLAGRGSLFRNILANRKLRLLVYLTSALIALNWLTYVYAINTDRIVEASLGYYINPLVSVFLGMVFLRERLTRLQTVALVLAICGVSYNTFSLGSVPWIAITLAFSFGLYGLFKKIGNLDSVTSLTIETMLLTMVALPVLLYMKSRGTGAFGSISFSTDLILAGSGIVSALPLYLFSSGAKLIPLSRVGFLQYIAPTLSLVIGVLIYGEPFTHVHAVSFAFIWTALVLYTVSGFTGRREAMETKES